ANRRTGEIIAIAEGKGREHDFKLFKRTIGGAVSPKTLIEADGGYTGLLKLHANSAVPKRKSKQKPLTKAERKVNRVISSDRMLIENINAKKKVFKIFSTKYRNRRKRHSLRMSLVCGLLNAMSQSVSV
ncbi:MAG: IS5/IS1182 family transposase, partial [Clostridiales bacterium]|nr:IS5/IS1182 family transposase [Clostridiales bacterium]